jgi:hypothetical protein
VAIICLWGVELLFSPNRWDFVMFQGLSLFCIVGLLFLIAKAIEEGQNISAWHISSIVVMAIVAAPAFGTTFGLSVKYSNEDRDDVFIRSGETLHDATIIMLLSHHSIFRVGQQVITVPSADVSRIVHTKK